MKRMMLAATAAMVLAVSPEALAEKAGFGIAVGQVAPPVSETTQTGIAATLQSLKGEKGLVIAFVRSADWCPFCKAQLEDLNSVAAGLEAEGYPLVALSYDPVDTLRTFADRKKIAYTLLSDIDSSTIDAFGVRNEEVRSNKRMNGIPHPVIFVLGQDGVVKAKLYEEDYRKRPASSLVLQTVQDLP